MSSEVDNGVGYPTPEAAALSVLGQRTGQVRTTSRSPDGEAAVVLIGLGDAEAGEPPSQDATSSVFQPRHATRALTIQVVVARDEDGWWTWGDSERGGWWSLAPDEDGDPGVLSQAGDAPPGAHWAVIQLRAATYTVPVQSGHWLFVAWDEPGEALDYPSVVRFLPRA